MTEPEFSRPTTLDDLKLLLQSLWDQGADYLLVGGYALAAHGYQRATTDIDLLVPASAQAGQHVKDALLVLPDQAAKDIDLAWFQEGENIRVADAFVVDILLNANFSTPTATHLRRCSPTRSKVWMPASGASASAMPMCSWRTASTPTPSATP